MFMEFFNLQLSYKSIQVLNHIIVFHIKHSEREFFWNEIFWNLVIAFIVNDHILPNLGMIISSFLKDKN